MNDLIFLPCGCTLSQEKHTCEPDKYGLPLWEDEHTGIISDITEIEPGVLEKIKAIKPATEH